VALRGLVVGVVAAGLLVAGCSSDDGDGAAGSRSSTTQAATTTTAPPEPTAVGVLTRTFVDDSRPTAANGSVAERPERTIETDVFYPAKGDASTTEPVTDAAPERSHAPYPLVVFAHGLGATIDFYRPLLQRWAAKGYVVAAPHFPLTYAGTEGGISAADVENQPADVSFVIDELLAAAPKKGTGDRLSGLIDAHAIAVAGHSNGAITTMGLIGNSCCRDPRIDAAVVMSGTTSAFSTGDYDLTDLPPTLWVHGTEDELVSYDNGVDMFNQAVGPKGLVTLQGADHGGWLLPDADQFDPVVTAMTDFLAAYLRDDTAALARIPGDGVKGSITIVFTADEGAKLKVERPPRPPNHRVATADDTTDLTNGQTVTVTWKGFDAGKSMNIVQCTGDGKGGTATCDLVHGKILQPDPTGEGSLSIEIVVGAVGNGTCDASHPCTILVNDSGRQDPDAFVYLPITLAG
jgi:alpha-beta hydrolase superfamily lysophospholipase